MEINWNIPYEDESFEKLVTNLVNFTPTELAELAYLLGLRRLTAFDIEAEVETRTRNEADADLKKRARRKHTDA